MSKKRIGIAFWAVTLLSMLWIATAQAQGGAWSEPYRLSSETGVSSEGYLAADPYGNVHLFWTESRFADHMKVIKYARFDGGTYTIPNDIYETSDEIVNVSPYVDQSGTLHIAWAEGFYGPVFYTHAPASNALSAKDWAQPVRIDVPARTLRLQIDMKGVVHILYVKQMDDPGVYYIRSEDQGATWSEPVWLDPDILHSYTPDSLNFELDESGGLHAAWFYGSLDPKFKPDWVRYTHSRDGGLTWSRPILIDQVDEQSHHYLTTASPVMIVQGQTVHIIWAAGEQPYRFHRYSTDGGETWSASRQIFGELHGQAFDGLTVDGAGRVHYFAQIRYPLGIYHAYWDTDHWTQPSLVYMIAQEGEEIGDRIHAHDTHPIVRAGNQLLLTFADGPADPNRRLFAMFRTLDDISPSELAPTPIPAATPLSKPSPTSPQPALLPTLMATAPVLDNATARPGDVSRPDLGIWVALVPNLLLFGGVLIIRLVRKSRQ